MIKFLEKSSASFVGLYQALSVSIYCALIAGFFNVMSKSTARPGYFGFFLILTLLVFSAAVCGSLVFGYPTYLVLIKKKTNEALKVLAFTLCYALIIIFITTILVLSFASQLSI